ncbi:thiol reductant ABC exporter subunit CydD [Actinocorallia sp. API 0066]|uniref:thiol reductant ABC exporter subunit CydD n=1 Tax=Actinocorallia sp. API 0066 TaxID=2896846 RepID=UPI001E3F1993|nr:thiol reductant ABC exporter subunit CydD [Actinocorallia sp. API 0066]MCD0448132.1 thiol reductant ABC exporter subunit CydD [Actinocorallia sp. API 0066]
MRPFDPRLARYARATVPYLLACVLLGTAAAALVIAQSWLLAHAIAALTVPWALLAVFAARAALAWLQEVAAHRASAGVKAQLRATVLHAVTGHAERSSPGVAAPDEVGVAKRPAPGPMQHSPVEHTPSGGLAALVTRGVDALDPYFARYLPQLVLSLIVPVVVLVALFSLDPASAVIVAVTLPLIPMFGVLIGTYTAARTRRQWRTLSLLAGHFSDVVSGLATLKVFGRARAQLDQVERVSEDHRKATMSSLRIAFLSALALELAATLSVAVVAVSVGLRLVHGGLPFETALFVLILAPEAYLPLRQVGTQFHAAQEGLAAAEEIFATLPPATARDAQAAPGLVRRKGTPEVVFDGLVARPGLLPLDLTLEAGTSTALMGPSGSGKSSVAAVLLGLVEPASGRVLVDGTPLGEGTDWESWRRAVAWMPQRPYLFPGTVAENIALAVPGAPEDAVREAAAATGTNPDLVLGEHGHGLSAGQRQRVALARVHLRCALLPVTVLLLDEPTAHLDATTELDLAHGITRLAATRTTLVITHRPSLAHQTTHTTHWPTPNTPKEALL